MGESGAQLTSVNITEPLDHPSIFEVLAQESLLSTLRPAFKHAFRVLAGHNPARYGWLFQHADEVCVALQLLLENHYLKYYGASFSENFYSMRRVATSSRTRPQAKPPHEGATCNDHRGEGGGDGGSGIEGVKLDAEAGSLSKSFSLDTSQHIRSLLCVVIVPYLTAKCDQLYERLAEEAESQGSQAHSQDGGGVRRRLVSVFLWLYPLVHGVWETTVLVHLVGYVFGKFRQHSPLLQAAGVLLLNLSEDDLNLLAQRSETTPLLQKLANKSWSSWCLILFGRLFRALSVSLSFSLSVGVFFLQFLDWWYTSDRRATAFTAPPLPHTPTQRDLPGSPKLSNLICPLCLKIRTNDTVLSVTGYVFCYPCIYRFVEERHRCPMTGYPAELNHLVKLYLSDNNT